jgi:uncharacterized protein YjbI with pentapeptide repeats
VIHKNLTPFYWAPRITSRQPPQPEMAVCVRGVFVLQPGKPLEAIEDPIEQGFMSGDTFLQDDIDQAGALQQPSDFAEWKLHGEMLLKGTCHPPDGPTTACDVRFSVGDWSKSLHVIGPRAYSKGLLIGGKASEPQLFASMPLSWENAFGGPDYPSNTAGRGHTGEEMPTVEVPGKTIKRIGGKHEPATMLGISPNWAQRQGKRGKNYGATWKKTRAPFYADDFDWTYFQSAAPDQWIDGYLRGDEDMVFENLHPDESLWRAKLPALRIRAFVKGGDGSVLEPTMNLDTLYADVDDGKLYLIWRGHVPVKETDLTDVQVVLIASEPLADEELPFAHYAQLLAEFEEDPVGLEAAFPPGFLAVATAIEAAQIAERDGEPLPDLKAVADNMPAGCPFPPWFLAAVAGDDDPLGIKAQMPDKMFDEEDPLGIKAKMGGMADPEKLDAAMAELPKLAEDPTKAAEVMQSITELLPPDAQAKAGDSAVNIASSVASGQQGPTGDVFAKAAAAKASSAAPTPVTAAEGYAASLDQAKAGLDKTSAGAEGLSGPAAEAPKQAQEAVANAPQSFDESVAAALEPLDSMELPEAPEIPDVEADLAAKKAELAEQETALRKKHGDEAILGLFAMGNRLIDNAPRPGDLVPDLSPIAAGLGAFAAHLSAQGASDKALGPLTRLQAKVKKLVDSLPQPTPPPAGEFALANLRGRDFSGQQLQGAVFEQADLNNAKFVGTDLTGANFRKADLTKADLTGAILIDADFSRATLAKANLTDVRADRARFVDANLSEAILIDAQIPEGRFEQAKLAKADLQRANLQAADMRFATLSEAKLEYANLSKCDLSMASANMARCDHANLSNIKFDMGSFTKCRLQDANLQGARSSMGSLSGSDMSRANLSNCNFEKVDFMKSVADGANFDDANLQQAILRDTKAIGATFRRTRICGAAATGEADFSKAVFVGADGTQSTWMDVKLTGADFSHSSFPRAYFQSCTGEDVNFESAQLKGACFRRVVLIRPRFATANLCSADFTCAELNDANFRGANCYDVKLLGAKAIRSDFQEAFTVALQLDDPNQKESS